MPDDDYGVDVSESMIETPSTAVRLALNAAEKDPGVAADTRELLRKQTHYLDLQMENLHEQRWLTLSHLRWRRLNDQMKGALQILVLTGGVLIAIAVIAVIWGAAHDHSLVVETFSVPPDMAAQGNSGAVVATHVMDRISDMENGVTSFRAKGSYRNNWENNIKVNIPDTGVSVSDAYGFLVGWLGDQTHITGDVVHSAQDYTLTARVSGGTTGTFEGPELEPLVGKAAEHILGETQPYLYAVWLGFQHRNDESNKVFLALAHGSASPSERAWAFAGLISERLFAGDFAAVDAYSREALRLNPNLALTWNSIALADDTRGRDEAALKDHRKILDLLNGSAGADVSRELFQSVRIGNEAEVYRLLGDFAAAASLDRQVFENAQTKYRRTALIWGLLDSLIKNHDVREARELLASTPFTPNPRGGAPQFNLAQREMIRTELAVAKEDWRTAAALHESEGKPLAQVAFLRIKPAAEQAYALAKKGDVSGAQTLIDKTPGDCDLCMRMRGKIRAAEKNWPAASFWFAAATRQTPSLPFAYTDWGAMLLEKGDPAGAIEKFRVANGKGPRFGDPLEGWGEALIAENRSDLAVSKFEQADQSAPNWGRLHLKWAEALLWSGDVASAKTQIASAAHLDLTAAERAELTRVKTAHHLS